jgi:uncharacterized protein
MVLQSLFYISAFTQLFQSKSWQKILSLFAPVGKMALTNYVLQTLFYIILFFHWTGLQLYGRLTITETYLLAIGLFALQVLFSSWWMKRHEQGPVEKIWKKLAYKFSGTKLTLQPN